LVHGEAIVWAHNTLSKPVRNPGTFVRAILTAVAVTWAATGGGVVGPAIAQGVPEYTLGPGDQLHVTVFGQEDLSGDFELDGSGTLTMPLLGQLPAMGRTVRELQNEITVALDRDYLVNPKVSVEVLTYRPFYILGEVESPGRYPYEVGLTVRRAAALAGGYTRRASKGSALVIRNVDGGQDKQTVDEDSLVFPGDTIEIKRRVF